MVLCDETETLALSPIHIVHTQARSTPEDYNSDIIYDECGNISKKSYIQVYEANLLLVKSN